MTTHGTFTFDTQSGADADRFIYDSPTQTAATLPSAAGTTRNLCHDTNGGNSTNVGPDTGQGGNPDGYLYTECSSPGANGDVYTIQFDTALDASAEQWQFNFYTCQRGPAIGNNQTLCDVQINENGAGWVTVSSELGGSGNDTTDGTAWTSQSIDLSESGANTDSSTLVRIRITSQAATTWWADYGIDTVTIVGTPLASREQDSFRFYDDGTESGSTALETQNTDISISPETPFQLRVGMQAGGDPAAESAELQYKETSDGASEWRKVP